MADNIIPTVPTIPYSWTQQLFLSVTNGLCTLPFTIYWATEMIWSSKKKKKNLNLTPLLVWVLPIKWFLAVWWRGWWLVKLECFTVAEASLHINPYSMQGMLNTQSLGMPPAGCKQLSYCHWKFVFLLQRLNGQCRGYTITAMTGNIPGVMIQTT